MTLRHRPTTRFAIGFAAALALAACGEPGPTALEPETARLATTDGGDPCTVLNGQVVDVHDRKDQGATQGRVTGDLQGTLSITQTRTWNVGVVRYFEGAFSLDAGAGEVYFGDGVSGARVPTGDATAGEYRYGAGADGNVDGGDNDGAAVRLSIVGWLDAGGTGTLDWHIQLCG